MNLQADMFEDFLTSLNIKEVNILAHDLGLTVALELLARQVNLGGLQQFRVIRDHLNSKYLTSIIVFDIHVRSSI